jgi:hypothetical protein
MLFDQWAKDLPNFNVQIGSNTVSAGVDPTTGQYGVYYGATQNAPTTPGGAAQKTTVIPGWGLLLIVVGIGLLAFGGLAKRL